MKGTAKTIMHHTAQQEMHWSNEVNDQIKHYEILLQLAMLY